MNPNATDGPESSGAGSSVFDVMGTMRAMRRLKPDPVPDEMVARLIEAATLGPSASNAQAYAFVVVTDRAQMQRLAVLWRRCVDAYLASFGRKPAPDDLEVVITPGYGPPGMPGYDPTPHELKCN